MAKTRREFIQHMVYAMGAASLTPSFVDLLLKNTPMSTKLAFGATPGKRRRHLINIAAIGGWDSSLFHNGISSDPYERISQQNGAFLHSQLSTSNPHIGAFSRSRPGHYCLSKRWNSGMTYSPTNGGSPHFFSEHFQNALGDASFVKDHLTLWKGIEKEGEHGIGNFAIQQGTAAPYAKSFASLIAKSIAQDDYVRPLHHVAIATEADALHLNTNMTVGFETPTFLPDPDTFSQLTRNGIQWINRTPSQESLVKQGIDAAVLALSQSSKIQSQYQHKTSQEAVQSYGNQFSSLSQLSSSKYGESPEMRGLVIQYGFALARALDAAARAQLPSGDAPLDAARIANQFSTLSRIYGLIQSDLEVLRLKPMEGRNTAVKPEQVALAELRIRSVLMAEESAARNAISQLGFLASVQQYAMTDFFIRNDLTAVSSLSSPCGDTHFVWKSALANLTASFSLFKQLLFNLNELQLNTGGSLLDSTLVVMHSEMDRWPFLEEEFGTNHGPTASMILSGYGVKKGAIVGGIVEDPTPGRYDLFQQGSRQYTCFEGLPIDPVTGLVQPRGKHLSVFSILPTLCSVFGTAVPGNQITEAQICEALLRRG